MFSLNRLFLVLRRSLFALPLLLLPACTAQQAKGPEKQYMFWPPTPDTPHVEFLTTIASTRDVTGQQGNVENLLYGKENTTDLPFARPYGIRMYNGCIYVCDTTSGNVSILDLRKKEVRILGKTGTVTLLKPIDIAVASDGIKYVADTGLGAIAVYDATDKYAGKIVTPHLRPVSIAVLGNELYVADIYASRVRVYDRFNGKELRTIGEPLAGQGGKGQLGGVMGIAVDSAGNVYANDVLGCRVQKFTPDGKWAYTIGGIGDRPGNFVRPKHMTVDSSGILYVVDNAFQNVQMFNDKGHMLMYFGAAGSHPGAMEMPTGICTNDTDIDLFQKFSHPAFEIQRLILVTNNAGRSKISVYGLGVLKPGKTVADLNAGRVNRVVGFEQQPNTAGPKLELSDATQPDATTQPTAATQPAVTTAPTTAPAEKVAKP
jgi:DNA-binding beta-propeller fold protein YncE